MKRIVTSICLFVVSLGAFAQTQKFASSHMFWTETILVGKIKGKFNYQFDYQYRRQSSDASKGMTQSGNIFANPYQQVLRPWIHYQFSPEVRFSLSPIGYWAEWKTVYDNKKTKTEATFLPEFRICPQITLTQRLGRLTFDQRYRYEFRYFGKEINVDSANSQAFDGTFDNTSRNKGRFRYFIRATIPLNSKENKLTKGVFYINAFNEIFLNVGKNSTSGTFDQNRTFIGLGYKVANNIRFEIGYLDQFKSRLTGSVNNSNPLKPTVDYTTTYSTNNILQVFLIFDDFNKFFQKKEQVAPTAQ